MLCKFDRLVYPKCSRPSDAEGYMVAIYRLCEELRDSRGNLLSHIKAVGYYLPVGAKQRFDLSGHWTKTKHGLQYEVEQYTEVITPSREGVIAYLSSGQIKGIGPKTAEKIYDSFGSGTLDMLDREPEKLLSVSGISEKKLRRILDSYMETRVARDVVAYLAPYGITANRAVQIFQEYGHRTLEVIRRNPYQLREMAGVGFRTADNMAMQLGFSAFSPERVDEALLCTLEDAQEKGHLCMEKHAFIDECRKLLNTDGITVEMAAVRAFRLVKEGMLCDFGGCVYLPATAEAEQRLAKAISEHSSQSPIPFPNLDQAISEEERRLRFMLAPEQRAAVKMALSSKFCVITGGPGTGKTSVQRALLELYQLQNPEGRILCCAPTGRAAKRMEESTGFPSFTVHKALGIKVNAYGQYNEPQMLDADMVLVDEVSMLDVFMADQLLLAIPKDCQLVLVGDAEQLPSVGPGAVLREIIASGEVPVVQLDKVYRQKAGSRIAINARLIRHGNLALEYGPDFQFIESNDIEKSPGIIDWLYLREVKAFGVENVTLLTPYRKKTATSVDALNARLRDMVNPKQSHKPEAAFGDRLFRLGDKVMQVRNNYDLIWEKDDGTRGIGVFNGDIGFIKGIDTRTEIVKVLFDDRYAEYDFSQLGQLSLAYATTIHKSQGSEYKSVIINLQSAHSIMLKRPLIYTAITRARERVLIVGERRALCIAIKRIETELRGTKLAERIQMLSIKQKGYQYGKNS